MRYGDEVVPVERLDLAQVEADPAELGAAERLVAAMAGEFRLEEHHDEYDRRLRALMSARRAERRSRSSGRRGPRRRGRGSFSRCCARASRT